MPDSKKVAAWVLEDDVANGPVTFPGLPGVYSPGEPVTAEDMGVTAKEMEALVKSTGAPLKQTTHAPGKSLKAENAREVREIMLESNELANAVPDRDSWIPSETEILPRSPSPVPGLTAAEAEAKAKEEAGQVTEAEATVEGKDKED